jgi:hypothetical protein
MVGFRVRVNQDRVVTVGLEGDHVVSLIIAELGIPIGWIRRRSN